MAKILNVYFHEEMIGRLEQDNRGEIHFSYSTAWLDNPEAVSISCSLPLQEASFNRKECHAFFGGLLPEESQRKIIAKNLGISANNDFSMLEKIGGECAGALSFLPENEKLKFQDADYHELSPSGLHNILNELPMRPLLAGEKGIRLSLAGVQDKLAVYVEKDKIHIPLNNAPSTHILKPDFGIYEGVIFNEAFCLKLAGKIGLSVAEAEIRKSEDIHYLLVKRYDRIFSNHAKKIIRVHQEDFCQALGIASENKYQNEGGPSLKQCFSLIRDKSYLPVIDLGKMINAVIFNFLIGNCDAHGKNFSLLYLNQLQFSPLYDLISTVYYKDLSKNMAMKIGKEYQINKIRMTDFDKLADEIQLSGSEIRKRIRELIDAVLATLSDIEIEHPIQEEVANLITERCQEFYKR